MAYYYRIIDILGGGRTPCGVGSSSGVSLYYVFDRRHNKPVILILLLLLSMLLKAANSQQQQQQMPQIPQIPQLTEEKLSEILGGGSSNNNNNRPGVDVVVVRFDPPLWSILSPTALNAQQPQAQLMDFLLHQIIRSSQSSMVSAVDVYRVPCVGGGTNICVQCIKEIPVAQPIFAKLIVSNIKNTKKKKRNRLLFEKYKGKASFEDIIQWAITTTTTTTTTGSQAKGQATQVGGGRKGNTGKEEEENRKEKVCLSGGNNSEQQQQQRCYGGNSHRQGVYIYHKEAWAQILDTDCGVSTFPPTLSSSSSSAAASRNDQDDYDVPMLDAEANPLEYRDPGYFAIMRSFIRQTIKAGIVVDDPEKAAWFLVPFDFDRSYALGDSCVIGGGGPNNNTNSNNSTHLSRVQAVLDGLQSSKYWKRRNGTDHVLALLHWAFIPWRRGVAYSDGASNNNNNNNNEMDQSIGNTYFPQSSMVIIRKSVILRYIDTGFRDNQYSYYYNNNNNDDDDDADGDDRQANIDPKYGFTVTPWGGKGSVWWLDDQDWRCTVTVPVLTPKAIIEEESIIKKLSAFDANDKDDVESAFLAWQDRPYLFHYRGNGAKECGGNAQPLHDTVAGLRDLFVGGGGSSNNNQNQKSIIETTHSAGREQYASEIASSKFCLVIRGDDPHRSRFNDAVAAGCIPVFINDGWHLTVAPFTEYINYRSFTVTIPESMFLIHPPSSLHYAYGVPLPRLRRMYKSLLWHRPLIVWGLEDEENENGIGSNHSNRTVGAMTWKVIEDDCVAGN